MSQPNKRHVQAGERFGLWTVVREAAPHRSPNGTRRRVMVVQCVCGGVKAVDLSALVSGSSSKCRACADAAHRPTITIQGVTAYLTDALEDRGIPHDTYSQRMHRGWPQVMAATRPVRPYRVMP
jgi:hypothetical protein